MTVVDDDGIEFEQPRATAGQPLHHRRRRGRVEGDVIAVYHGHHGTGEEQ